MKYDHRNTSLGEILRRQRVSIPLTLQELSSSSGVSSSHLGRMERGERFPSASILRSIAKPLGFEEDELFTLAGYLSPNIIGMTENSPHYTSQGLDPYVARVLSQESVDIQRATIGILSMLKSISKSLKED